MKNKEKIPIQKLAGKTGGTSGSSHRTRPSFNAAFTSLQHRNYRLWFTGQLASLIGTWMQTTAIGFLVFQSDPFFRLFRICGFCCRGTDASPHLGRRRYLG